MTRSSIVTTEVPLRTRTAPKPAKAKVTNMDPELEKQLLQLTAEFYKANKECNAAKSKADKAKKELDRLMSLNEVKRVDVDVDGVPVEALYEAGSENVVDIQALAKLVDMNTLMSVVSASQKDVKETLGDNVLNRVLKTVEKEPALKVRARK